MIRIAALALCWRSRSLSRAQATFKSTTALVEVDAIVLDKNGNFVPGLKAENITILENGKPQKIQQFFMVTNDLGLREGASAARTPTRRSTAPTASSCCCSTRPISRTTR